MTWWEWFGVLTGAGGVVASILGAWLTYAARGHGRLTRETLERVTGATQGLIRSSHEDTHGLIHSTHEDTQALIRSSHEDTQALIHSSHEDTQALIHSTHDGTQALIHEMQAEIRAVAGAPGPTGR